MRVLRAFLSSWLAAASWLPAASLLMIGTAAHASEGIHPPAPPANAAHLSHGRFKDLLVYKPAGAPTSFVLFLSGDEGWNPSADTMARQLVQQGAMVAAIDWAQFKANLEADGDECVFPDGDLENLSHFVQAYFHVPTYLTPMLVGVSSGAAMAYAVLAQAPSNTFAAALTLGFCPEFQFAETAVQRFRARIHPQHPRPGRGFTADQRPRQSLGRPARRKRPHLSGERGAHLHIPGSRRGHRPAAASEP